VRHRRNGGLVKRPLVYQTRAGGSRNHAWHLSGRLAPAGRHKEFADPEQRRSDLNVEVTIVRARHQEWEAVSILVPAIWLVFYALAVVGTLTGPQLVAEVRGTTTVANSENLSIGNGGRPAWK